jgi:hypothetical protein
MAFSRGLGGSTLGSSAIWKWIKQNKGGSALRMAVFFSDFDGIGMDGPRRQGIRGKDGMLARSNDRNWS